MATTEAPNDQPRLGRRCDMGCETWPDEAEYARCPVCEEPTSRYRDVHPLSPEDAQSKVNHIKFERYYEDRCARRGVPSS